MKIKTNIRAGAGGSASGVDTSTSTSGANAGGVNSKKPTTLPPPVYYSRCVGI